MRLMRTHKLLLLFFAALPFATAGAQDPVPGDAEGEDSELRRYTVEVIIFNYAQEVSAGTEIFVADPPPSEPTPLEESALAELTLGELPREDEIPLLTDSAEEVEEILLRDVEFVPLDEEEYTMGEIMEHLERLDVYEPVMHFGWTQATWPQEETQAIDIASFARPPAGLEGSLTLYLSRYLHLVVDLQLDAQVDASPRTELDDPIASYGDYRAFDAFGEPLQAGPVRYRIQENRILRNGDLRYFDHPKFGVLAKVTRFEEAEDDEQDETAPTELLGYGIE